MVDITAIAVLSLMFLLSLLGAVVLFKFLKSSALIKKAGYQAGGALAGFLLIYWILYHSLPQIANSMSAGEPVHWRVIGTVTKGEATRHDGIIVSQVPPIPSTPTDLAGNFDLKDVIMPRGALPEIYIDSAGYYPQGPITISTDNATINRDRGEIRLKQKVTLFAIPASGPSP